MKLIVSSSSVNLWREIIHEAEVTCATPLQVDIESYLVFMLVRFTNQPEIAKKIMATDFLESANLGANNRHLAFQGIGDTCLLFSGFFPGLAEKRLVKISYFIGLGRTAYSSISRASNDIYSSLAQHFVSIMDILQTTRVYSKDYPDLMPLEAYELWNESGSKRALTVLKQFTQATPLHHKLENDDNCLIKFK